MDAIRALGYRQAPILMYHRLTARTGLHPCSLAVARFRQQLALLRRLGYRSVSPLAVAEGLRRGRPAPPGVFAITFDDGYLDTLTVALPLLVEYGFTATVYLVGNAVGRTSAWTAPAPLMEWDGVRAWLAAGMEVGAHSLTHADLTTLDATRLAEEVAGAKARLEDRLGIPVASFAYPFNRLDRRVLEAVASAGYRAGCAGVDVHASPHALCRVDAAHRSWARFAIQLPRGYPALRAAVRAAVPRRRSPAGAPAPSAA